MKTPFKSVLEYTFFSFFYTIAALFFILLLGSCSSFKKDSDIQGAIITEYRGTVTIQKKEASYEINPEDLTTEKAILSDGTILETQNDSRADLQFATGISMRIGSGTKIKIEKTQVLTGENFSKVLLYLEKGKVFTESPKLSNHSSFRITTPTAAAMVRGTKFHVSETDGTMITIVHEGSVAVSSTGRQTSEKMTERGMKTEVSVNDVSLSNASPVELKESGLKGEAIREISPKQRKAMAEIFNKSEEQKRLHQKTLDDFKNRGKKQEKPPSTDASPDEVKKNEKPETAPAPERVRDTEEFGRLKNTDETSDEKTQEK
ncbi:MAG: FecR family protein [Spirochaetia bacterium]|nr:FecR family protein [Spirochaetia bacterium]